MVLRVRTPYIINTTAKWLAVDNCIDVLKGADFPMTGKMIQHRLRLDFGVRYQLSSIRVMVQQARLRGVTIETFYDRATRSYRYEMRCPTC